MEPGSVLSYLEMCQEERVSLQRGMNYRLGGDCSVILMSTRPGAPYIDQFSDDGQTLTYEGHDVPKVQGGPDPKREDQLTHTLTGTITQNGLFFEAAKGYLENRKEAELVRVYEKIRNGIWVFNGLFRLVDAWQEFSLGRNVFKFKLELTNSQRNSEAPIQRQLEHNRLIPSWVKLAVWKRDNGQCTKCGSVDNLHFDHIIPFSKGGSSKLPGNVQLLCARHNLAKRDNLE